MYLSPERVRRLRGLRRAGCGLGVFDDLCVRCPKCQGRLVALMETAGPAFRCLCPGVAAWVRYRPIVSSASPKTAVDAVASS